MIDYCKDGAYYIRMCLCPLLLLCSGWSPLYSLGYLGMSGYLYLQISQIYLRLLYKYSLNDTGFFLS